MAAMETLPKSMESTTICSRAASKGSAPAMIMPTIAPGRKIMPVVFVESISGIMAFRSAVFRMGETACRLVAPRASAASTLSRCSATSSRTLASVRLAVFMAFPITMPPSGIKYRAVAGTIPSKSSTPRVATAATPIAPAATGSSRDTPLARRADVQASNGAHPRQEQHDRREALQPEDIVYRVPYGGELHKRTDHGDADVLLEVQPLVEAQSYGHGHKTQSEQCRAYRLQTFHATTSRRRTVPPAPCPRRRRTPPCSTPPPLGPPPAGRRGPRHALPDPGRGSPQLS